MYNRLKSMLVAPKGIVQYTSDRTIRVIAVIFCYILLLSIPSFITSVMNYGLDAETRDIIIETFEAAEPVEFQITAGKLIPVEPSTRSSANVLIKDLNLLIVFNPNYEFENEANLGLEYMYCIVFTESEVKFALASNHSVNFTVCDYSMFDKYVNFKEATSPTNNEFWTRIFSVASDIIDNYKVYYFIAVALALFIKNLFSIALSTFILMVFMRFVDGTKSWLYTKTYKMAVYCYLPCVLGNLLSILFSNYFLYLIGFMITTIYAFIVAKLMAMSKIKN